MTRMTSKNVSRPLGNRRGLSLFELILFSSVSVALLLWLGPWLAKPARIQQKMLAVLDERKALRATDTLVNDLKQVVPGSLTLDNSTPDKWLAFEIAGDETPPGELPGPPMSVTYSYRADPQSSLYRTIDGSTTVVLSNLLPPDPAAPVFRVDPVLRILTMDFRLPDTKGSALRVVRRVALPN